MTPIIFLVLFCGLMSAIAVTRVLQAELLTADTERDLGDIGAALITVGVTLLATFWMAVEEGAFSTSLRALTLGLGIALSVGGFIALVAADDR